MIDVIGSQYFMFFLKAKILSETYVQKFPKRFPNLSLKIKLDLILTV